MDFGTLGVRIVARAMEEGFESATSLYISSENNVKVEKETYVVPLSRKLCGFKFLIAAVMSTQQPGKHPSSMLNMQPHSHLPKPYPRQDA